MDNDFVIYCNLFIIIRTISLMVPIKVYAGIPTPHRPVYVEVYSPPGITDSHSIVFTTPFSQEKHYLPCLPFGDWDETLFSPLMGYYPYATYLLPHFPEFRPASRPSSLNPSAY